MPSTQLQGNKCSKIGHWAQACRGSKPGKLLEVEAEQEVEAEGVDLHEVQSDIAKSPWTATLLVFEKPVTFKLYIRIVSCN